MKKILIMSLAILGIGFFAMVQAKEVTQYNGVKKSTTLQDTDKKTNPTDDPQAPEEIQD